MSLAKTEKRNPLSMHMDKMSTEDMARLVITANYEAVKAAEDAHVMDCIECGACSFGCPAYRTITQSCRRAKATIRARIAAEKAKAAAAAAK